MNPLPVAVTQFLFDSQRVLKAIAKRGAVAVGEEALQFQSNFKRVLTEAGEEWAALFDRVLYVSPPPHAFPPAPV